MTRLTHTDAAGHARMVDVGGKAESKRVAIAGAEIAMAPETLALILDDALPKGDVLAVARIAGIMAAKRTAELIPLCHPLALDSVTVQLRAVPERNVIEITAECALTGRTGVEMEALTAVSIAALTLYDMCKSVDRGMVIGQIRLLRKSGGRSGEWRREEP